MTKILIINGSPHAQGSTQRIIEEMLPIFADAKVETETVWLGSGPFESCRACNYCKDHGQCVIKDLVNETAAKCEDADGFVFGSPVHYAGLSGAITTFLGRLFYAHAKKLSFKPVANFVVCRRGGNSAALDQLNKFATINNMPLVSSQYWNMVHGANPKGVAQDAEGLQTMRQLARNLLWLIDSIAIARQNGINYPKPEPFQRTNFIEH
jgi:multimeric flavodoxin WrbA